MIKSAKAALATHFSYDMAELDWYKYQQGRYSRTIYAFDDGYWCAVKNPNQLPKDDRFHWVEEKNEFVNQFGWRIFVSRSEDDEV